MTDETQGAAPAVVEPTAAEPTHEEAMIAAVKAAAEEPAVAPTPEGEGEDGKPPKKTAKERIDELTRARHDAERVAEEAIAEAERLRAAAAAPVADNDAEPNPEAYPLGDTDPQYLKDMGAFGARSAMKEARAQDAEQAERNAAQAEASRIDANWAQRETAAEEKYPDYDEKVRRGAEAKAWPCTPIMAHTIKTSEQGADVAYHLASNPDEARRIEALDPVSQIRAIGRLEAQLADSTPKPKTVTDAPAPLAPARGQSGKFQPPPDTDDFASFAQTYG